jgi:hypothetical protein
MCKRLIPAADVAPCRRGAREDNLRRVGEHIELANLAAFLVSGGAAYINGDAVVIDGGKMQSGGGGPARSRCYRLDRRAMGGDPAKKK